MSLPLEQRKIIPMIQNRERNREALAIYQSWVTKPDKVEF